jgi:hypothetical protein
MLHLVIEAGSIIPAHIHKGVTYSTFLLLRNHKQRFAVCGQQQVLDLNHAYADLCAS